MITLTKEEEKIAQDWKDCYFANAEEIDQRLQVKGRADWEAVCVGFCLAKGLSVVQALTFYSEMVKRGLF